MLDYKVYLLLRGTNLLDCLSADSPPGHILVARETMAKKLLVLLWCSANHDDLEEEDLLR